MWRQGDASLCFLKRPSCELAIDLLDEVELRDGFVLRVSHAVFEKKKGVAPKPKRKMTQEERAAKMLEMKQAAALSWADDGQEDDSLQLKIVVLKNAFDASEFTGEAAGDVKDLEDDVREECMKLGEVEKVTAFPKSRDGVLIIKFKRGHTAKLCVEKMHGRFLGGRKLGCEFWDGITNYAESDVSDPSASKGDIGDDDARLDAFGDWLEGGSDSDDDDLAVATE